MFDLPAGEYKVQAHDATGGWIESETITLSSDLEITIAVEPHGDIPHGDMNETDETTAGAGTLWRLLA